MRRRLRTSILAIVSVGVLVCSQAAALAAPAPHSRSSASRSSTSRRTRYSYPKVDPTKGDVSDFDDPVVRQVAVDALGHLNGSVLALDPSSGRILTVVNQHMAFSEGFEPCSTIKPVVALAGLEKGVITRDTMLSVARRRYMDLTEAMAHSNNKYFEVVGKQLGFDTVVEYAKLLGLGQRTSEGIPEEQPGSLPAAPPWGGVARMSSFGSGFRITPFQLASLISTLANGGTMYFLQYPRTAEELAEFTPKVRRQLDIAALVPEIQQGMLAAVLYGTARGSYDPAGEQPLGKTGTCNDENAGGRIGWYVSYADVEHPKIVLVVLLRGGSRRMTSGPKAADIAGKIYRGLSERNFFATRESQPVSTADASGSGRN